MENNIPRQGEIYKHYKGNLYQITAVAMHTETEEMMVVYQALYGEFKYYTRPLKMFMDKVNIDGREINRFTHINFYNAAEDNIQIYSEESNVEDTRIEDRYNSDVRNDIHNDMEQSYNNEEIYNCEETYNNIEERPVSSLIGFLDAKTYTDKMNILKGMKSNGDLNEQILRNCALSIDCAIDDDGIDEQYYAIMNCLRMLSKYECTRLR